MHEACAGDESLEREIESLLTGSDGTEDFLEIPALELEARALAQHQIRSGGRLVALKFLGSGRIADPEQERRLVKEATTASRFHHPETIINRCLRKDPEKRFQTMADVRVALVEVISAKAGPQ